MNVLIFSYSYEKYYEKLLINNCFDSIPFKNQRLIFRNQNFMNLRHFLDILLNELVINIKK